MRVLVTGSTGFVGSALVPYLARQGHDVKRLVRGRATIREDEVAWDPEAGVIDADGLAGVEAVVHMAGQSIAAGRWTERRKRVIRESRTKGTTLLSETLAGLDPPPRVLACATGKDYYGDRADEILREDAAPGSDFLAEVAQQMESASVDARQAGTRVANLRFGYVLDPAGGLLARVLPIFKLGLGGRLGSGRQYTSWIAMEDLMRAIHHVLVTDALEGPVNMCSPGVVTNAAFTKTLGRVLSRPAVFRVPALALRAALGEVSDALLSSQRMDSSKLRDAGFGFRHADLEDALEAMLSTSLRPSVLG